MKRYGPCARLSACLVVASTALAAAQPVINDLHGRDVPREAVIVAPPVALAERADSTSPQVGQQAQRGNPLWGIPIKNLTATRDRPIFSSSRRPPPPMVAITPYVPPQRPVKPASPQLTILGTVLGAAVGEDSTVNTMDGIGIFLDQTNNTVVRLKTGDYHNGWLLRSLRGREATLQYDREAVVLALPARGTERGDTSRANTNTNISAVQPAVDSHGKPALPFQLDKYD